MVKVILRLGSRLRLGRKLSVCLFLLLLLPLIPGTVEAGEVPGASNSGTGESDTVTVCHRVSGDSGPQRQVRVGGDDWNRHKKHGDKRGPCRGLVLVKSYPSSSGLQDFKFNADTSLRYLLTVEDLEVYRNDTVHRSVTSDSNETILLSKNDVPRAAECEDRSSEFESSARVSLLCRLLDATGKVADTAAFPNHSQSLGLVGERLLVSRRGEPALYDFRSDSTIWDLTGRIREVYPDDGFRHFLALYTEKLTTYHELRRLSSGELISRRQVDSFHREISQNGSFLYLVRSEPSSRTKELTVFNRQFKRLAHWKRLPFYGKYIGEFSVEENKVYVPLTNGKLFIGNVRTGDSTTKPFPPGNFDHESLRLDRKRGLLFVYGKISPGRITGYENSGGNRGMVVYDIRADTFLDNEILFSRSRYNFNSRLAEIRLRLVGERYLAVQHPRRLELYRIQFE